MNPQTEDSDRRAKAEYYFNQANLDYDEAGNFAKALLECDAAIKLDPFYADAHNLRGILLEELERPLAALAAYEQAIRLDPDFREAKQNLAELKFEAGLGPRLVTIATFSHPTEAYILKSRLEAAGVWSLVADENIVIMNWLYSNAVGGVKVQVRETDVERVLDILDGGLPVPVSEENEQAQRRDRPDCPNCGSFNTYYEQYAKRLLFASWLLSWLVFRVLFTTINGGIAIPFLRRRWKCKDCGNGFKAPTVP